MMIAIFQQGPSIKNMNKTLTTSSAPEIYQRKQHQVLEVLKGIEVIADDILVYGNGANDDEAMRNHNTNVRALFETLRSKNMKINNYCIEDEASSKINCGFFGLILSGVGVKIDPDKTVAICNMSWPENQVDVFRTHHISLTYGEPLRQLMLKDKFEWPPEQEMIFMRIKEMVTTAPVLRYFDPKEPVTIQLFNDSCSFGLGRYCKLLNPFFASRLLTKTEKN
jgi:phospholipid N-methyltransferase